MDVSAARLPDTSTTPALRPDGAAPVTRLAAPPRAWETPEHDMEWTPHSVLKFSLSAADVDARFEIHEATNRVIVTMYERETGEVLREIPSRKVLDMIASLLDGGLWVDETR